MFLTFLLFTIYVILCYFHYLQTCACVLIIYEDQWSKALGRFVAYLVGKTGANRYTYPLAMYMKFVPPL